VDRFLYRGEALTNAYSLSPETVSKGWSVVGALPALKRMAVTIPELEPVAPVEELVDDESVVETTKMPCAIAEPETEEVVELVGEGEGEGEGDMVGVAEGDGVALVLGEGLGLGDLDGFGELLELGRTVGGEAVVGRPPPPDPAEEEPDELEPELELELELELEELELLELFMVRLVEDRADTRVKSASTVSAMVPLVTVDVRYLVVCEPSPLRRK